MRFSISRFTIIKYNQHYDQSVNYKISVISDITVYYQLLYYKIIFINNNKFSLSLNQLHTVQYNNIVLII